MVIRSLTKINPSSINYEGFTVFMFCERIDWTLSQILLCLNYGPLVIDDIVLYRSSHQCPNLTEKCRCGVNNNNRFDLIKNHSAHQPKPFFQVIRSRRQELLPPHRAINQCIRYTTCRMWVVMFSFVSEDTGGSHRLWLVITATGSVTIPRTRTCVPYD